MQNQPAFEALSRRAWCKASLFLSHIYMRVSALARDIEAALANPALLALLRPRPFRLALVQKSPDALFCIAKQHVFDHDIGRVFVGLR